MNRKLAEATVFTATILWLYLASSCVVIKMSASGVSTEAYIEAATGAGTGAAEGFQPYCSSRLSMTPFVHPKPAQSQQSCWQLSGLCKQTCTALCYHDMCRKTGAQQGS